MHASVPEPLHRKHDASHAEHCFSPVSADVVPYVPASHWSMQRPLVLSHGRGESAEQDVHDVEEDGALHVLHSDAHGWHLLLSSAAVPAGQLAMHVSPCDIGVDAAHVRQSVSAAPLQVPQVWWHVVHTLLGARYVPSGQDATHESPLSAGSPNSTDLHARQSEAPAPSQLLHELWQALQVPSSARKLPAAQSSLQPGMHWFGSMSHSTSATAPTAHSRQLAALRTLLGPRQRLQAASHTHAAQEERLARSRARALVGALVLDTSGARSASLSVACGTRGVAPLADPLSIRVEARGAILSHCQAAAVEQVLERGALGAVTSSPTQALDAAAVARLAHAAGISVAALATARDAHALTAPWSIQWAGQAIARHIARRGACDARLMADHLAARTVLAGVAAWGDPARVAHAGAVIVIAGAVVATVDRIAWAGRLQLEGELGTAGHDRDDFDALGVHLQQRANVLNKHFWVEKVLDAHLDTEGQDHNRDGANGEPAGAAHLVATQEHVELVVRSDKGI
eukprot:scaffold25307_cov109-Isochrysis_galbana.AAC.4